MKIQALRTIHVGKPVPKDKGDLIFGDRVTTHKKGAVVDVEDNVGKDLLRRGMAKRPGAQDPEVRSTGLGKPSEGGEQGGGDKPGAAGDKK